MALKLVGNTGSHNRGVNGEDVLDAFEIVEHALFELIDKKSQRLAAFAQSLTDKHRPDAKTRKPLF